jgi:hypothetical protein
VAMGEPVPKPPTHKEEFEKAMSEHLAQRPALGAGDKE